MNCSIMQFVLAVRDNNDQDGGWIQLLVFVVMAVLWTLGGIRKAKANKIKDSDFADEEFEKGDEPPTQLHPAVTGRPLSEKAFEPAAKPAHTIEQRKLSVLEQRIGLKPFAKPDKIKKLREVSLEPIKEQEFGLRSKISLQTETPKEPPAFLLNFDETDALKKAVLYHEILGKPLALKQ